MKSDDFLDTNKALVNDYKEIEKEKYKQELLKEEERKQEELRKSQLEAASIPDEKELEAVTQQHIGNMIRIAQEQVKRADDIRRRELAVNNHNHLLALEEKANNENLDAQFQQYKLYKEQQVIDNEIKQDDADFEQRVEALGSQLGQLQIQQDGLNQLQNGLNERRQALFQNAKSQANIQFQTSPQMQAINSGIANAKAQTLTYQKEAEQRDLLAKEQKKVGEAILANQVSQQCIDGGLSNVEQVQYLVDNEVMPRVNDFQQKEELVQRINELIRTHQEAWRVFTNYHPDASAIAMSGYRNASKQNIQSLLNQFSSFIQTYKPLPQPDNDDF